MSVVLGILAEERDRLKRLLAKYEEHLAALPQGSVSMRKIGGGSYLYMVRREGKRVFSEYMGSAESEKAKGVLELDSQRRVYKQKRREILSDLSELKKALGKFAA